MLPQRGHGERQRRYCERSGRWGQRAGGRQEVWPAAEVRGVSEQGRKAQAQAEEVVQGEPQGKLPGERGRAGAQAQTGEGQARAE